MTEFRADLHCHSTCSDGTMTPKELVRYAKEVGLDGLSITDHDSINAYESAIPLAEEIGLRMVSGVEFSSTLSGVSVHVLGYSFSLDHPAIANLCRLHEQRRLERNRAILEKLKKSGMPIDESVLSRSTNTTGRPHIAVEMVAKGYVGSVQEAFNMYLGDGKSCYAEGQPISTQQTIDAIHEAKGFAVIAHPHLLKNDQVLFALLRMNFDGIEGYYAKFMSAQQKRWVKIGEHKGWLVTGGSDFHGGMKPHNALGSSWVRDQTFEILEKRFFENNQ
jgi:predicted metal-dependent phosphoesterase TrpH